MFTSSLIDNTGRQFLPSQSIEFNLSAGKMGIDFTFNTAAIESQNFYFNQGMLAGFRVNVPLNFTETMNGIQVLNVPSTEGNFFGAQPVGGHPFLDMGVNADAVNFETTFNAIPGNTSDLGSILLSIPYGNPLGSINGTGFRADSFVVTDPPTSVPAPSDWLAVLLWCVVAIGALAFSGPSGTHGDP